MPGPIVTTDIDRDDFAQPFKTGCFERRILSGRIGEPIDNGDVVMLRAREGSHYVDGAEVVVDGVLPVNLQ